MPFTFVAGQHGFALFAPYLACFLATAHFTRAWRKRPIETKLATAGSSVSPTLAFAG